MNWPLAILLSICACCTYGIVNSICEIFLPICDCEDDDEDDDEDETTTKAGEG